MRLYRPEQERPADAALTALLPPGESRRLPDTELSELVGRIAQAVPVRPQNRKFREDVIQDVVLEGLRLRAEEPTFLSTFEEIVPWVKRAVAREEMKTRRDLIDRPDHADETVTALQAPRDDTNPAMLVEMEELAAVIRRTVARMSPARRQVLRLIREDKLDRPQAAMVLGKSESTIKNHLTLALADLHQATALYLDSGKEQEKEKEPKP